MLPAAHRLRTSEEFRQVRRLGKRANTTYLAVSVYLPAPAPEQSAPGQTPQANIRNDQTGSDPVRVGFVVSKKVGNAVTRNRVVRRLRHLTRPLLDQLPAGAQLVVNAYPPAATASSATLNRALTKGLAKALKHTEYKGGSQ